MATPNNTVRITPNATSKSLITPYKQKPTFGFIQLSQDVVSIEGGWIRNRKRSCLVRAEIANLQLFVSMYPDRTVPGRIQVQEFVESEVPEAIAKQFLNSELEYEERIKSYVKTTGTAGEELTLGGERILRFSDYDPSGQKSDITVQHDNQDDLAGMRAARTNASAQPQNEEGTGAEEQTEENNEQTADADAVESPAAVLEGTQE
jgi:hypothetical protein